MELKTPSPPERFLRGRQKRQRPVRRVGRTVLRGVVLSLGLSGLVAVFVWTVTAAGTTPELAINRVFVEGNTQLSDGEILELLDLTEGANILLLDLEDVRTRLLRSAWVKGVEIERVLPRTLTLRISERKPVAVAVLDDLYLLAADGTILDQLSPRYDIEELVLARGLHDESGLVPARARLAGRLAAALLEKRQIASLVSEIDVGDGSSSVALHMREPGVTILVDGQNMVERLAEIVPILSGIQTQYAALEVVDLRFDGRVYLRVGDALGNEGLAGSTGSRESDLSVSMFTALEVHHSE